MHHKQKCYSKILQPQIACNLQIAEIAFCSSKSTQLQFKTQMNLETWLRNGINFETRLLSYEQNIGWKDLNKVGNCTVNCNLNLETWKKELGNLFLGKDSLLKGYLSKLKMMFPSSILRIKVYCIFSHDVSNSLKIFPS